MRRYTVLHVDGERGLRGGERQLLHLAGALRARGHRGIVVARRGAELAGAARAAGLEAVELPLMGELDFLSATRLAALARREGAIVHAHSAHACGTAALAGLAGVPVVMHRRVDFPVSGSSARFKYGMAGKVVAVSRAIAAILRGAGLPEAKLAVVPDAIPVDDEEAAWSDGLEPLRPPTPERRKASREAIRQEFGITPDMPLIGNMAALVPHKDHDTLLAAAVIVLLKRPEARFLVCGSGPEEERLREEALRMGLARKLVFAGQRADGPELMRGFDLYCQSSWGEGMGSVLIEAMAAGVPIAATTAGGIPEVVEDGVSGLLAPPRDPEALAAALLRLLEDEPLRRRLAAAGRERLPRFGLRSMAQAIEEVYAAIA
jgi:glycosyltransferase involved in cell wall biosynthesis